MRRKLLVVIAVLATAIATAIPAGAAKKNAAPPPTDLVGVADSLDGPLTRQVEQNRAKAMEMKLTGKIDPDADVAKITKGQYVELEREDTDKIFVVIAEFGNTRHPSYPDSGSDGTPLLYDGPLHNSIPEPDRTIDNATLWQSDYSQAHYEDMYFNRMAAFYERQSSGKYSVEGAVTAWVKVPFNEARYGRDLCGSIVCNNTWFLIRDGLAQWVQDQLDSGMTMPEIQAYLQEFDEWDRYDLDGDGNFDEPDGFIDHFQIVHAGGDQAAGDPWQGSDAIWSHRWYAQISGGGPGGLPGVNIGQGGVSGGVDIPNNPTGIWVGDYTIQPENGGLGVFAHEFGHDLGLPDLYDTSGNTGGAENSTGFWTLMSSGSNIGNGGCCGIADQPVDLGLWEKFQLGWVENYEVAFAGETSTHKLGPAEYNNNYAQGAFVVLPDKLVEEFISDPYEGDFFYYSGAGNDLDNVMYKAVNLPAGSSLTAQVNYDIESDWDYAYVVVSTDGGTTWEGVPTDHSDEAGSPNGQDFGHGISGSSGGWASLTADLSGYTGDVLVGFRYWTDVAVAETGFMADNISINGDGPDGAETDGGWTFTGFKVTSGIEEGSFFNAYVVENRGFTSYDISLKTAYNFGFLDVLPDWVEFFPYQPGILISYWDTYYTDNNVGDHPGSGEILPVDAHPDFYHTYDGHLVRQRILSFDSTFGKWKTKRIVIHKDSKKTVIPSRPGVATFDDTLDWWFNADQHAATGSHIGRYQPGWTGVDVPDTGTTITVVRGNYKKAYIVVKVAPK